MSTVESKTQSTAAAVDVKVGPNLSTDDRKLVQRVSDDDSGVTDQQKTADALKNQQQHICEHPKCGRSFSYACRLRVHQYEHKLQAEIDILGKAFNLTRESLDDRWVCPIPDCQVGYKTINKVSTHLRANHDDNTQQQQQQNQQPIQQQPVQKSRYKFTFLDVDEFYVNGVRCGYHTTTGVLVCYDCRLVPECLLTHLQQKHGYNRESIDKSALPEGAVSANVNPNGNQHISNPLLASAIRYPHWQQHQDIIQGWLCITSNCGYCGYTSHVKSNHRKRVHQGEQMSTVPALVLRLSLSKTQNSSFLITHIDQATANENIVSQHGLECSQNGLDTQNDNEDGVDQNETTDASNQKQQWKCEYDNCKQLFNSANKLYRHQREHKSVVVIYVYGNAFVLARLSSDGRWACPVSECEKAYKTIGTTHTHIVQTHSTLLKQKCDDNDDDDNYQQQNIKKRQYIVRYLNVDYFDINGVRYGYHNPTGLFICYECRLVPECLSTHLQQSHGFNEKSIDNALLPESARANGSDPNGNQHTNNSFLVSSINQPYQHRDIIQGWMCVTSDCGYCGYTVDNRRHHKTKMHCGIQLSIVPALVLRLLYGGKYTSCFLITRLDTTTTNSSVGSINSTS